MGERHVLICDLGWLEYAIADYVAKCGTNWTGRPYLDEFGGPAIAGLPTAVANMAMTVIGKNLDAAAEQRLEALEEIRQRVACGWQKYRQQYYGPPVYYWFRGNLTHREPMSKAVASLLWPEDTSG